jgi:hypothetical protein
MGWGYRLRVVMWLHSVMYDVVGGGFGLGARFFSRFFSRTMQVLGDFRRKVTMTIHCCNLHHNVWDHTISIPNYVVAAPPQPNSLDISDRQTDRQTHTHALFFLLVARIQNFI